MTGIHKADKVQAGAWLSPKELATLDFIQESWKLKSRSDALKKALELAEAGTKALARTNSLPR